MKLRVAIPDLISPSYFPAIAAVELGCFKQQGFDAELSLLYPVTNAAFDTATYDQFADGPWLTRKAMEWFWDAYAPDLASRAEPTVSPLRATVEQLRGLPPALVITDEADVLRDEGEAYGRKLREAGVDVTAVRYEGVFHDFMMLNALAETDANRNATAQVAQALRAALLTQP
jgi:acetyl esterase